MAFTRVFIGLTTSRREPHTQPVSADGATESGLRDCFVPQRNQKFNGKQKGKEKKKRQKKAMALKGARA